MNDPMFQPVTSEWAPEAKIQEFHEDLCFDQCQSFSEASMRWVDYFYSEEGSKYIEQGPEGFYGSTKKMRTVKKFVCRRHRYQQYRRRTWQDHTSIRIDNAKPCYRYNRRIPYP